MKCRDRLSIGIALVRQALRLLKAQDVIVLGNNPDGHSQQAKPFGLFFHKIIHSR
jgi:hypothetical protein